MKLGFLITARLKSTRLPRKILLDLNGRSVLDRVIDRCLATKGVDSVVLCTSTHPQDEELRAVASKREIAFFAGAEDDVLQRLTDAAVREGYDAFLSMTADNPLFSIEGAEALVRVFRESPFDFGFLKGLPIGCMPYGLRTAAARVACYMKSATDTEIWGPFVRRDDFFHVLDIWVDGSPFDEAVRLTCDYPADYELMQCLFERPEFAEVPALNDVLSFLARHPDWWEIIAECSQRWPREEELAAIRNTFDARKGDGMRFAAEQGIDLQPGYRELRTSLISCADARRVLQ